MYKKPLNCIRTYTVESLIREDQNIKTFRIFMSIKMDIFQMTYFLL